MKLDEFKAGDGSHCKGALRALWFAGRGDWDRAHEIAQAVDDRDGAWVHAWLHRQEGDITNAGYWYRRAGRPTASGSSEAEWEAIAREMLAQAPGRQ